MFGILIWILCTQASESKDLALIYAEYIKFSDKLENAYTKKIYAHEILTQNKKATPRECRICGDYFMYRGYCHPSGKSGGSFVSKETDLLVSYNSQKDDYRLGHYATIKTEEGRNELYQSVIGGIFSIRYPYYMYSIRMNVADLFQARKGGGDLYRAIRADMLANGICRLTYKYVGEGAQHVNDMTKADGYVDLDTKKQWVIVRLEHYQRLRFDIVYEGEVNGVPKVKSMELQYGDKFKQPDFQGRIDTLEVVAMEPCNSIENVKELFTPQYYGFNINPDGVEGPSGPPYLLFAVIAGFTLLAIGGFLFQMADRKKKLAAAG